MVFQKIKELEDDSENESVNEEEEESGPEVRAEKSEDEVVSDDDEVPNNQDMDEEEEEDVSDDDDDDYNEDYGFRPNNNMQNEFLGGMDDDTDSDDEDYLQKFDNDLRKNIIQEHHPELVIHSNEDIQAYTRIVKNEHGQIIDPLHTTLPFITKYERARVLGERAKQLDGGAKPLVPIEKDVIDGYLIALKEFEQKKIPFIVKRPMPSGGCEYWKLKDLEII
jgi:DNA-directed RNA polymerase I, II, and III subunit RPABC2